MIHGSNVRNIEVIYVTKTVVISSSLYKKMISYLLSSEFHFNF